LTLPDPPSDSAAEPPQNRPAWLRWLPLGVLVAGTAAFFALGLDDYVTFDTLARHRGGLLAWVEARPFLAPLLYIVGYVAAIAFSLPGGVLLTVTGGFLFGPVFGALFAILGATGGATCVYLAARTALGERLRAKAGSSLQRLQEGFRQDAFSYLLVLRLVPLFPFFLVNIVPAFAGVPVRTYVVATFIGIIPGAFVFASVGNGLGAVFDAGQTPDLRIILKPQILLPILGLALLALIPVGYRRWKGRNG
jgi:uncharacterized membrane protein YdjX (TVP38/TMEM64 family)